MRENWKSVYLVHLITKNNTPWIVTPTLTCNLRGPTTYFTVENVITYFLSVKQILECLIKPYANLTKSYILDTAWKIGNSSTYYNLLMTLDLVFMNAKYIKNHFSLNKGCHQVIVHSTFARSGRIGYIFCYKVKTNQNIYF